jgi:2-dehydropantoate 2-reductase
MNGDILIAGSGALATLFSARLAAAGVNVTMLATWRAGLAALGENGACLEGVGCFPVRVTDNLADCQGARYVIVLVKSWQTQRVASQLAGCLADDSVVVTFQNGIDNPTILSQALGSLVILQGVTTMGATLLAPGLARSGGEGEIVLEACARLDGLAASFQRANFQMNRVSDILPYAWGKLVINAAINPLTAILGVKNGELLNNPPARELMNEIANEAAEVAGRCGIGLPFANPGKAAEEVARRTAENRSSMLQDIQRAAPTEVDAINGAVVKMGIERNVPVPTNQMAWRLVKAMTARWKI